MAQSNAEIMVGKLEIALAKNVGVVSISVDGTTVSYNRSDALKELQFWERRVSKQNGRRPRLSSIKLENSW